MRSMMISAAGALAFVLAAPAANAQAPGGPLCRLVAVENEFPVTLTAIAATGLSGSYQLSVRQGGARGNLVIDQSGGFRSNGWSPARLTRIIVGGLPGRPDTAMMRGHYARPGQMVVITERDYGYRPANPDIGGFQAQLRVYDLNGRLVCNARHAWG